MTSALAASFMKMSSPSGVFRLSARLRLLRCRFWKSNPSRREPVMSLAEAPGGSILMTLAPQSASWRTAVGPARACVKSSTVKRESGSDPMLTGGNPGLKKGGPHSRPPPPPRQVWRARRSFLTREPQPRHMPRRKAERRRGGNGWLRMQVLRYGLVILALLAGGFPASAKEGTLDIDYTAAPVVAVEADKVPADRILRVLGERLGFAIGWSGTPDGGPLVSGKFRGKVDDILPRMLRSSDYMIVYGSKSSIERVVLTAGKGGAS